jgi:hypothetical protein
MKPQFEIYPVIFVFWKSQTFLDIKRKQWKRRRNEISLNLFSINLTNFPYIKYGIIMINKPAATKKGK